MDTRNMILFWIAIAMAIIFMILGFSFMFFQDSDESDIRECDGRVSRIVERKADTEIYVTYTVGNREYTSSYTTFSNPHNVGDKITFRYQGKYPWKGEHEYTPRFWATFGAWCVFIGMIILSIACIYIAIQMEQPVRRSWFF